MTALPSETVVAHTRSLDTDWLLDLLTSMANGGGFTVAVTLWTPAGIVAGDLIGASTWIRELRETIRTTGPGEGRAFAEDLQSVEEHIVSGTADAMANPEPLTYLHLNHARTLLASGEVFEHGLWRGRFVDITGWTLGRP